MRGTHCAPGSAWGHHGSSPRMRGTLRLFGEELSIRRFIPAHAGNTVGRHTCLWPRTVHPRACGEHMPTGPLLSSSIGSSPRMRGTLGTNRRQSGMGRFIPAHAGNTCSGQASPRSWPVHPRACGEHIRPGDALAIDIGSSPRMRGTLVAVAARGDSVRFIPAHAGNTARCRRAAECRSVHPRACGEHAGFVGRYDASTGSSPRMRGTLERANLEHWASRFIPAHAGNTRSRSPGPGTPTVHPRACGEHFGLGQERPSRPGSSPRMRGTLISAGFGAFLPRFIPAHAGNTSPNRATSTPKTVHPRACGEHFLGVVQVTICPGSSPRMRGTHLPILAGHWSGRFIPAHAGNTSSLPVILPRDAVHPRACGEHGSANAQNWLRDGSSPRMRGTQKLASNVVKSVRFIPAHAGNTGHQIAMQFPATVHPRACGEHSTRPSPSTLYAGSSPRMRGTRKMTLGERIKLRFIPAHAGNTVSINGVSWHITVHPRACGEHTSSTPSK